MVECSSTEFCGYDSTYFFEAEDQLSLECSEEFEKMIEYMEEYIAQDNDPEDEDYTEDYVHYNISESTKLEFDLYSKDNQF